MKKRLFTWIICLIILLAVSPMQVFAAETVASGTCGDNLTWTLDDAGTLTISGTGDMRNYSSNSYAPWNEHREAIKTVVIENGVTSIGNYAFYRCTELSEVTIPESVTSIGNSVFSGCSSLTEIIIPEGVTSIGNYAFSNCSKLSIITIPEGVTSIGNGAFSGCSSLTDVYYGGTESEWNDLDNTPNATRIHYDCSSAEGHWMVHGKLKVCDCGYIAGENPFADVPEGSFYYNPVMWAVINGITKGVDDTHFGPDQTCNRGQVVTFLWRAAGKPEPTSSKNPFVDVKEGDFFYKPVLWAIENNITKGVDATHFGPDQTCNRSQVVTFLWRAAGKPEPTSSKNPFVDVKSSDFFYKPVLWALEKNITKGVDDTHFGPDQSCNRGQVVTFLYRTKN